MLRRVVTVALGVLFVLGFGTYLAVDLVHNRLLDETLYTDALADNHIYHRVYTDLLADPMMVEITADFLREHGGDGELADSVLSMATSTLYLVLPPAALESATEGVIEDVTSYLKGERELPDSRFSIAERLDEGRMSEAYLLVAQAIVTQRIADALDAEAADAPPDDIMAAAGEKLAQGELLALPPGLGSVRLDQMSRAEKSALATRLLAPAGDRATPWTKLQVVAAMADNDLSGAIAAAIWPLLDVKADRLAEASMDALERSGKLDGIQATATFFGETEARVRERMSEMRMVVRVLDSKLQPLAVLLMALALAGIVWIHADDVTSLMRSVGLTLLVASGAVLAAWLVLRIYLAGWGPQSLQGVMPENVPPSLYMMVQDAVATIVPRLVANIVRSTLVLGLVGGALVVLSNIRAAVSWIDRQLGRVRKHRAAVLVGTSILLVVLAAVSGELADRLYHAEVACNGHRELCSRRVNEVAFASTHNGMSVADHGWLWPSHDGDLTFQLDRGIRGLFIDTHYYDAKASLDAYLTDASPEVRQVVEDTVDLLGLETKEGTYLCHLLCHLGSTPLVDSLEEVREWLDEHPREVVVMVIEDKISVADTSKAFEDSGLVPYTYSYPGEGPWPTLGELIRDNQRLIVMAEVEGPPPDWYHHVWDYVGETPYTFASPEQFSCEPNRGGEGKPMLLLNHWIERVSPSRTDAIQVNSYDFLLERARQCEEERDQLINFVAVNFFLSGDVIDVVDTLNGVGYRTEEGSADGT